MEDFSKIVENFMNSSNKLFFSLYDGHGGSDPVKYAKERMPEILSKMLDKKENDVQTALNNSFVKLDDELKFTDSENSGCTATVVMIIKENDNKYVYCANVGDSKSVLISKDEIIKLSYDHKCTDSSEVNRIKNIGGMVFNGRVFGQLVLTRALGDHALKKYGVSAIPHVIKLQLESFHKYIIIASDGIWDVITEENLLSISKTTENSSELADLLVKTALTNGSRDNISCIVIKL